MLYPLPPDRFPRAQALFYPQSDHHLFCAGVLAGKYTGQVIADHPEHPRSALLFKPGMWGYLGGDPHNTAFNQVLGAALTAKQFVGDGAWGMLFQSLTAGWREVLNTLVLNRLPIATSRFLYVADADHFHTPPALPSDFSLHLMDASLPAKVSGQLPADVQNVLDLRATHTQPDHVAFGYVALHGRVCVAWSMVDCIVGARGEIGLETEATYQRRGLGAAVSGATIQYGLAHGLTAIHWDVISHNIPSVRLADKHGLQRRLEYDQNLIIFDQMGYLANLAWDHLDKNRFQAALEVCQPLLALENGQKHGHYLIGAAWAGLGDANKAVHHLHRALDHGWDSLAELEHCAPLRLLHDTAAWAALVQRLQGEH